MKSQPTLYGGARMDLQQSIELTAQSLRLYGERHGTWSIAYSGGKDSTALVTSTVWLIEQGIVPRPRRLYVLYGDTRMELPPLSQAAYCLMAELSKRDWIETRVVMAPLDQRFFVYMLGRGVPPPNNNTLRWCTSQIKVEPMEAELRRLAAGSAEKVLMLIGVRVGESAARDARIALACSRNGAECGQGWYQRDLPDAVCDKLSPLLHWRTCLVWDWLFGAAGVKHGFESLTREVAWTYGLSEEDSSAEIGTRTGCVGCPLATEDTALEGLLKIPKWSHLEPLQRLRPIYRELREPRNRLRQPGGERRKDGSLISNQNRMGPLTMLAREWALSEILRIQREVNEAAVALARESIDILNSEEESRIRELMAANTWPQRWTGDEPIADLPFEDSYADGTRQLLLPVLNGGPQ